MPVDADSSASLKCQVHTTIARNLRSDLHLTPDQTSASDPIAGRVVIHFIGDYKHSATCTCVKCVLSVLRGPWKRQPGLNLLAGDVIPHLTDTNDFRICGDALHFPYRNNIVLRKLSMHYCAVFANQLISLSIFAHFHVCCEHHHVLTNFVVDGSPRWWVRSDVSASSYYVMPGEWVNDRSGTASMLLVYRARATIDLIAREPGIKISPSARG